jgi:hypothetical protein
VFIDHGRDPKMGKRKQVWHSGFATLSDAVEARTRLLRERDTGSAIDPSRQTLAKYLRDEWLPSREPVTGRTGRGHRGKVGVQTWDSYRGDLERNVIPRLGGVPLQKLTQSDLNRLYDELEQYGGQSGVGLSPKTIANIHGVIHKALGDAVKLGKVPRNVADAVEKPSAAKPAHDIWTPEQLGAFLTEVRDDRLYASRRGCWPGLGRRGSAGCAGTDRLDPRRRAEQADVEAAPEIGGGRTPDGAGSHDDPGVA